MDKGQSQITGYRPIKIAPPEDGCVNPDLSRGLALHPIPVINTVDQERPLRGFVYSEKCKDRIETPKGEGVS